MFRVDIISMEQLIILYIVQIIIHNMYDILAVYFARAEESGKIEAVFASIFRFPPRVRNIRLARETMSNHTILNTNFCTLSTQNMTFW